MATYEFTGTGRNGTCYVCKEIILNKMMGVIEFEYPMGQAPQVGSEIPCPFDGANGKCPGVWTRIFSRVGLIVRGESVIPWDQNNAMRTRINGQDVKLSFVDHPHTDPQAQRHMEMSAGKSGIGSTTMPAYMDEKTGKMCVDVVSNIPHPLGAIEREKRQHGIEPIVKRYNNPVRTRGYKPQSPRRRK